LIFLFYHRLTWDIQFKCPRGLSRFQTKGKVKASTVRGLKRREETQGAEGKVPSSLVSRPLGLISRGEEEKQIPGFHPPHFSVAIWSLCHQPIKKSHLQKKQCMMRAVARTLCLFHIPDVQENASL
jgi:hypothetical protein